MIIVAKMTGGLAKWGVGAEDEEEEESTIPTYLGIEIELQTH